ncbi:MAG: SpoIID/LytB domain-containing protein [Firmicutes bacterium]|nr:SpoIID/LytB domain-containing protein [Bacillota bacterium]
MKFTKSTGTIVAAIALIVVAGLSLLLGWPGPKQGSVRKFAREPTLSVYIKETGEKKDMPIEEYIAGVVAGEMKPNWPLEAYAAQAILARSFTMEFISRGGTRAKHGTDISTDHEEAQAYNADNITPIITRAVEMTRGEVMTYKDQYIRAWFHSYSGGHTTTAKEGLNFKEEEPPYIRSVKIKDNRYAPADVKEWHATFPLTKVQKALATMHVDVGDIQEMKIEKKGKTGRATELRVKGTKGSEIVSASDFRVALDAMTMKSTWLSQFQIQGNNLTMTGKGFGHGVGLSQWDAHMLAKEGKQPQEIVRFFFKNIDIKKLWD